MQIKMHVKTGGLFRQVKMQLPPKLKFIS